MLPDVTLTKDFSQLSDKVHDKTSYDLEPQD